MTLTATFLRRKGVEALEEYEAQQRAEAREEEAISTSKEANQIATHANEISKSSQRSSHIANVIAGISLAVAVFALLAELFGWQLYDSEGSEYGDSQSSQAGYECSNL